jgi:hypothetical protein
MANALNDAMAKASKKRVKPDVENAADARKPGDVAEDGIRGIKPSRVGSLHAALGVAQGQKIPAAKVAAAANSSSPALRKKAVFARNAAGWGK